MISRTLRPARAQSVSRLPSRVCRQLYNVQLVSPPQQVRSLSIPTFARYSAFQTQQQRSFSLNASSPKRTPQTATEKILQRHAVGLPEGKVVRTGDYISISPWRLLSHDNTAAIMGKFQNIGATKIKDPRQPIFAVDHDVQNKTESNLAKYKRIREFALEQGVTAYPPGRGIGHQIMIEQGHAWPGTLTVGSDSHSNMYGGVGCLGMAVVRSDAASIWATTKTWFSAPPVAKVTFLGKLPEGVAGKDVIVALCGLFNNDEVLNHAIEFTGSEETLSSLPVDDRLSIANMTTEWGALSGLFPIDSVLERWMRAKATASAVLGDGVSTNEFTHERIDELMANRPIADPGAKYAKSLFLDLSSLTPFVSGPNSVKVATPIRDLENRNIPVNKAYLVSCTNARASDLRKAANVFREAAKRGEKAQIADGVKFYIAAASTLEQQAVEESGDWDVLLKAGATTLPSGCGPCIGLGTGLLEPGEVGISASNRNFKGRMGSIEAKAYLGSPEIVAASALQGKIAAPSWYYTNKALTSETEIDKPIIGEGTGQPEADKASSIEDALEKIIAEADGLISSAEQTEAAAEDDGALTEVLADFPEKITGEIVFCDAENINTDGIYPGKYTYDETITAEKMAQVVMENFDPNFSNVAKAGDILVAGSNFGCGSSREQAATAILAKEIPLVISNSFANTFTRNSINNKLMLVEVPRLVERLRESFKAAEGEKVLTRRTGWKFEWDVRRSKVTVTEGEGGQTWSQKVGEVPPNVQMIAAAGLENWVKQEISSA